MRLLTRGIEPVKLKIVRDYQLGKIRGLGREPTSKEITGYAIVSDDLWNGQFKKCCYCEAKLLLKYNDVEHYRPKALADRRPGCNTTHGYWWMAFTWNNLMFSCPGCNRSAKKVRFPLANGCCGSLAEDEKFSNEKPLLINPYAVDPSAHIIFTKESYRGTALTRWYARARNSSLLGSYTIDVCDLNRDDLLELRFDHWENSLQQPINELLRALASNDVDGAREKFRSISRLFDKKMMFSAFTYDVLVQSIADAELERVIGEKWPKLARG